MKAKILLLTCCLFGLTQMNLNAQVKTPAASPLAKIEQKVGLTNVEIEYSRPSKKGRDIFGDLVPYKEMWRTGANGSTDISFSDDVKISGKDLKAGKYALYTIPDEDFLDGHFS